MYCKYVHVDFKYIIYIYKNVLIFFYVSVKMFRDKSVTLHMSNFMRNANNFLVKFSLFIFYKVRVAYF